MTTRKRKSPAATPDVPACIRKAYFECRYGQLHVSAAFPVGGGFDEHATLVCVHRSPLSSRAFRPLMAEIGRDRPVYAPDLPGCGESDPTPPKPSIEDYAAALVDFLDHMRLRRVDVIGHHTGSLIAAELAIARPTVVRRLMLVGLPILAGEERAAWARTAAPLAPTADGRHLTIDWQRTIESQDPAVPLAVSAEEFAIRQANGPNVWWMANAALAYPASERLPLIRQPVLLMRNKDSLWEPTQRARPWLGDVQVLDLPEYGNGLFHTAPRAVAKHLRTFLDR